MPFAVFSKRSKEYENDNTTRCSCIQVLKKVSDRYELGGALFFLKKSWQIPASEHHLVIDGDYEEAVGKQAARDHLMILIIRD